MTDVPQMMRAIKRQLNKPRWWSRHRLDLRNPILFGGDDTMFKELARDCTAYGEYGLGQSTVWMLENSSAQVLSVDTSKTWVRQVCRQVRRHKNFRAMWVDVGPVENWGRPVRDVPIEVALKYAEAIWEQETKPSLVLVDGRFRVACFLTSLLSAEAGTPIIFDDYTNRPSYHVVEAILVPDRFCGRQALFRRPTTLDADRVTFLRDEYLRVSK